MTKVAFQNSRGNGVETNEISYSKIKLYHCHSLEQNKLQKELNVKIKS